MKKLLLIGLCVIVGLLSFVGCGGNDSNKRDPNSGWTEDFY